MIEPFICPKEYEGEFIDQPKYDYVQEVCKLVNIDIESFKTKPYELYEYIEFTEESEKIIPEDDFPYDVKYYHTADDD